MQPFVGVGVGVGVPALMGGGPWPPAANGPVERVAVFGTLVAFLAAPAASPASPALPSLVLLLAHVTHGRHRSLLTPAGVYDGPWVGGVISPSYVSCSGLS